MYQFNFTEEIVPKIPFEITVKTLKVSYFWQKLTKLCLIIFSSTTYFINFYILTTISKKDYIL